MSYPKYIRIIRKPKDAHAAEVLFPISSIWKIEVEYVVKGEGPFAFQVALEDGLANPDANRIYKLYVGNDVFTLRENPDSEVMKIVEEIYKNAIKG